MKLLKPCIILLVFVLAIEALEKARYDNYRLYKFAIENDQQQKLIKEIEKYPDGYQIFAGSSRIGSSVELVVPPHKFGEFSEFQERFKLKASVVTMNLQQAIDKENLKSSRFKAVEDWERYWPLEEINSWMASLVTSYPGVVSTFSVGLSYEGRDIRGVKLNFDAGTEKKSIFFESMIHAYEWITPATTTWIINELLTSDEPDIRLLAERYEWYFVPVLNVDGYAYTWSTDRMWRKSRRPTKNVLCTGADLNRNWDVVFGSSSPTNPCHSRYGGDFVFSEPEAEHLSNFLKTVPRLVGYFAIYALGQFVMFPYAYTKEKIETYDILHEIGLKGAEALTAKHGYVYEFGALNEFFDPLSGCSSDWVALNLKTNVTFSFELRPRRPDESSDGAYTGLLLPTDQIIEVAEEVFAAITTILQEANLKELA